MRRLSALLLLTAAMAACTPFGPGGGDDEARLRALHAEIVALVGDAPADDVRSCRTLPVGHKPCGGPAHYLVYSAAASDSVRLHALAAEHAALQAEINRERGLASDCLIVTPPPVAVVGGRCVVAER